MILIARQRISKNEKYYTLLANFLLFTIDIYYMSFMMHDKNNKVLK